MDASSARASVLLSRPQSVLPLGNSLLDPNAAMRRSSGLGHFAKLFDDLILTLLRSLSPGGCVQLSCASAVLHAFCRHDELWKEHCLEILNAGGDILWPSNGLWRSCYMLTYGRGTPSLANTAVRVYSDVLYRGFLMAATEIDQAWLSRETLPSVDVRSLTAAEFSLRFEKKSRPVILKGCSESWPARHLWSKESLLRRVGDVKFQCGPCELPLKQFYAYAEKNIDDVPLFVFCKYFAERAPELLQDYENPPVFRGRDLFDLLGDNRPDFRWLLIGHRRSASKWHVDPNKTSAWNAVVKGRKRWLLLPPGCPPPGVFPSRDGADVTQPVSLIEWFRNFYGELRKMADGNAAWDFLEGTCGPGDAVFIPCGWWHCVLNLDDDTIAVTQNYVSESQVHSARRFLREKPDQVSGVCGADRKASLAALFDEALASARPDLLKNNGPHDSVSSTEAAAKRRPACKTDDDVSVDRGTQPQGEGFSFWDHLRSTGRSLGYGTDNLNVSGAVKDPVASAGVQEAEPPAIKRQRV